MCRKTEVIKYKKSYYPNKKIKVFKYFKTCILHGKTILEE